MMNRVEYQKAGQLELINVAQAMLAERINLVEGARRINALRFQVDDPDNKIFRVFRMFDSETQDFPLGTVREHCTVEFLSQKDAELEAYIASIKNQLFAACNEVLKEFLG